MGRLGNTMPENSFEECPCAIYRGAPGEGPIFQELFEARIERKYVYQDDWQWPEAEADASEPDQGISTRLREWRSTITLRSSQCSKATPRIRSQASYFYTSSIGCSSSLKSWEDR